MKTTLTLPHRNSLSLHNFVWMNNWTWIFWLSKQKFKIRKIHLVFRKQPAVKHWYSFFSVNCLVLFLTIILEIKFTIHNNIVIFLSLFQNEDILFENSKFSFFIKCKLCFVGEIWQARYLKSKLGYYKHPTQCQVSKN